MFNAKNTGQATKSRPKSPKNGAPELLRKNSSFSELNTPELKFFRSQSILKDGEHESSMYGPSNVNSVRLLSMRGRPEDLNSGSVDEEV